jgi:hypothetical protein
MPEKRETIAAYKKTILWGTEATLNEAERELLITNPVDCISKTVEFTDIEESGTVFHEESEPGKIKCDLSPSVYLRYNDAVVHTMLAQIIGSQTTPATVSTLAYTSDYIPSDNIEGRFGSFAVDKVTKVHTVPSVKWNGFTLSAKPGIPVEAQFKGIGKDELINSTVNTTLSSVTSTDKANRMQLKDAVIRVNDQTGATLGEADKITVTSFTFEFTRPQTTDYENDGSNTISEPLGDGYPTAKVSLDFRKYGTTEAQYYSDWVAGTTKKMDVLFEGSTIEGSEKYEFQLLFPRLKIKEVKSSGSNNIVTSVSMDCEAPVTAPSGMSGLTKPFKIAVKNKISSRLVP